MNHKRIYRLYCEEGLAVRTKKRRKRPSHLRLVMPPAEAPNDRWSMDFVAIDSRMVASFVCSQWWITLAVNVRLLEAGMSMTGKSVAKALERLSFDHPLPKVITVDNGTEFFSRAMDSWAYRRRVQLEFIRPGKPTENAFIESFNGRLRDECLELCNCSFRSTTPEENSRPGG